MTNSLKIRLALALLLIGGGVGAYRHPDAVEAFTGSVSGWFGLSGHVAQAVIVEETSQRSKLPQAQIIEITKAATLGVHVIDQNAAVTKDYQPFLDAAKEKTLPQLVRQWSNGRTTSVALPPTFDKLAEAVK